MSLLDSILGSVLGGGNSNQAMLANLAIGLVTNHSSGNGLAGLVQQFEQSGLGNVAQSWVGNGPNQPISGPQVQQALGSDQIQQLAAKAGLQNHEVANALAVLLPQIINHLTPNGQIPPTNEVQQNIGGLLQHLGL